MVETLTVQQPGQLYSVPGFPNYIGSTPGGGGGAVTSVFGRVGAVVANVGDYDSGQVTNVSGVAGATVTAALNSLAATIAGLTSTSIANASGVAGATVTAALNTLAAAVVVAGTLVTNLAQGQVPATGGTAGNALIATALGSTWSTNFQAQSLTTTGNLILNNAASFIRMGLVPGSGAGSAASDGDIRWPNDVAGVGSSLKARNAADSQDIVVLAYSSAAGSSVGLGDPGGSVALIDIVGSTTQIRGAGTLIIGMLTGVRIDGALVNFNNTVSAPTISQSQSAAAGQVLTLAAQGSTGAAGGGLVLQSGAGSTAITPGTWTAKTGATTVLVFTTTATSQADFQSTNLLTNGFVSLGATPSASGDLRVKHGFTWSGRNQANSADRTIVSWGVAANNAIVVGDTAASTPNLLLSTSTGFDLRFASTATMRVGTSTMNFFPSGVADFDVQLTGSAMLGLHATGTVRTIAIFGAASTAFQSGDKILFVADRTTAPTGNPTGGGFQWSETGGLPAWRTVAGNVVIFTSTSAATATAGGGAVIPATVSEFLTINFNGNVRKIALYAN